ncbi:hypothetical protein L6Q21_14215 [Sandaracinobacter sp. RS1-74]|uniref:hypothetical protein n=1 Tax=Sandaracinobacteroides sayramensis TaxID=2913411 RepID=UPI001EDAE6B5|nr:hypothetical protein [Sandaracinobacteroides sayramensis]MCG2842139.1 hypothetical protein [Sandaracinobacteroides sayramensis]
MALAALFASAAGAEAASRPKEAPGKTVITMTFPASISDRARAHIADRYEEATLLRAPGCGSFTGCETLEGALEQTFVKSAYWAPYIVEEMKIAAPEIVIELVPGHLDLLPGGRVGYAGLPGAPGSVAVDFITHVRGMTSGGWWYEPTTFAIRAYPMFLVQRVEAGEKRRLLAASETLGLASPGVSSGALVVDIAEMPRKSLAATSTIAAKQAKMSKAEWAQFTTLTPAEFARQTKLLDRHVVALATVVRKAVAQDPAAADAAFLAALGLRNEDVAESQRHLIPSMRAAEAMFIAQQTDALAAHLIEGEAGRATRDMLLSEREYLAQLISNSNRMILAGFLTAGTTMASGGNQMSAQQSILNQSVRLEAASAESGQTRNAAFIPVLREQMLVVGAGASQQQSITASTLEELRGKFRELLTKG